MADSKQKIGSPDRDRINVNEDYELRDRARLADIFFVPFRFDAIASAPANVHASQPW